MPAAKINPGQSFYVLATVEVAPSENVESMRQKCNLEVHLGNAYLPAFLSDGILYVQAPLGHVVQAVAKEVSVRLWHLEVRATNEGSATFSLDSDGRPIPSSWVGGADVVRDGEQR
jgi:hypothetical protein